MELPVIYVVIVLLVAAVFLWVTLTSNRGRSRTPSPGRQFPRSPSGPQSRGTPARRAPPVSSPRRDRQAGTEMEAHLEWTAARDQEWLDRSTRVGVSTGTAAPGRQQRQPTPPVAPGRSWQRTTRRARPALLTTPGAARQAFLAMELLRPPLSLRNTGEEDTPGGRPQSSAGA